MRSAADVAFIWRTGQEIRSVSRHGVMSKASHPDIKKPGNRSWQPGFPKLSRHAPMKNAPDNFNISTDPAAEIQTVGGNSYPDGPLFFGISDGPKTNPTVKPWAVEWDGLVARLKGPEIGEKDGSYFTCSTFEHGRRSTANQAGHPLHALVLDGDSRIDPKTGEISSGAPDPILVHEALKDRDITHAIVPTHSDGAPGKGTRYRVVIPCVPQDKSELTAAHDWVIDVLHRDGAFINPVPESTDVARLWFLPRVRDEAALARFLVLEHDGLRLFPMDEAKAWFERRRADEPGLCVDDVKEPAGSDDSMPIGRFNKQHGASWICETLTRHGYKFAHTATLNDMPSYRFIAPESESKTPGVVVFKAKRRKWAVFSHHGEHDPLAEKSQAGCVLARDAFDVFRILEHDGDQAHALTALPGRAEHDTEPPNDDVPPMGEKEKPATDHASILTIARQQLLGVKPDLPEYPVDALGALSDVAIDLAEHGQMDIAMAGQSVLGVASLCASANFDVETLTGTSITNLYLLTIGESGDGKTTAENAALRAVRQYVREQEKLYRAEVEAAELGGHKKGDDEQPVPPYLITSEGTVEGIRRAFQEGRPVQGVFSSEGAAMLSGHGMKPEHKAKTCAELNRLWDRGEVSTLRGMTGRVHLYDRRLAVHLMIQPTAVAAIAGDELLSDMGFWPRFLLAWPEPSKPRKARPFNPDKLQSVGAFWKRCADLLVGTERPDCSDLPVKKLTPAANEVLKGFFETMEREAKNTGGRYRDSCRPFAVRAAEQACRVAGVLAAFSERDEIDEETMRNGTKLALYSVESWRACFQERDDMEAAKSAFRYLKWMVRKRDGRATENDMRRLGPKPRGADQRDTAMALLHAKGFVHLNNAVSPPAWYVHKD
jgi:Protein of unknown function (DUF3987)